MGDVGPAEVVVTAWLMGVAWGKCAYSLLTAQPAAEMSLPSMPEVVLDAYGAQRAVLDEDARFALKGPKGLVPLEVVQTLRGDFRLDQWVLRPKAELPPGTYSLQVNGEAKALAWKVSGQAASMPLWTGEPAVEERSRWMGGCGPSVSVNVRVPVENATWVEVSLWRDASQPPVRGRLLVEDGRVAIGHGMCSGMFELEEGVAYRASFTAIGGAGDRVEFTSHLSFVAP